MAGGSAGIARPSLREGLQWPAGVRAPSALQVEGVLLCVPAAVLASCCFAPELPCLVVMLAATLTNPAEQLYVCVLIKKEAAHGMFV